MSIGLYKIWKSNRNVLLIHDVLQVLRIQCNLLLVHFLLYYGFSFFFEANICNFFLKDTLFEIYTLVYGFFWNNLDNNNFSFVNIVVSNNNCNKWQARLNHISQERLTRLVKEWLLGSISKINVPRVSSS